MAIECSVIRPIGLAIDVGDRAIKPQCSALNNHPYSEEGQKSGRNIFKNHTLAFIYGARPFSYLISLSLTTT